MDLETYHTYHQRGGKVCSARSWFSCYMQGGKISASYILLTTIRYGNFYGESFTWIILQQFDWRDAISVKNEHKVKTKRISNLIDLYFTLFKR